MKTIIFPGQGSQHKAMGSELFGQFPELITLADQVLGYSIADLCNGDSERLNNTIYTQPALYVVNALSFLERQRREQEPVDFFAGHSLGEYSALFAAGVLDFQSGLLLVKKRGELMGQAAQDGGMAAVIGTDIGYDQDAILGLLREHHLQDVDVANFNSPNQIVLSGPKTSLLKAQPVFERSKFSFVMLKVSSAFHSRYMESAKQEFAAYLQEFEFKRATVPVISNVSARPHQHDQLAAALAGQIIKPVQWIETIRYLMGKGVTEFEEVGPGKVLTKLIAQTVKTATPVVDQAPEQVTAASGADTQHSSQISPAEVMARRLGSSAFRAEYNLRYAYYSGSMYKGIASVALVIRMAKAGLLAFLGAGGLQLDKIESNIALLQQELCHGETFGVNLLCNLSSPQLEMATVELFLRRDIKLVEASAFVQITPALVRYRLHGLASTQNQQIVIGNRVIAKISRAEVAAQFLRPAPQEIVRQLLEQGLVSEEQARLAQFVPMADDLCVEADSGGHTDGGIMATLLPSIRRLRDELAKQQPYRQTVRVGAGGGIGTPEAAAAAFVLGADFICTGSINQCTVEAGASPAVKEMLQALDVQDTDYAPAGDMFELGAKVQVVKKGTLFAARANKLHELWRCYDSIDEINAKDRQRVTEKYFKRSFAAVYEEVQRYYSSGNNMQQIEKAERDPKHKMALIFRWYFAHSNRLALQGNSAHQVDFQIHCGPAMGAFNRWVAGSQMENWKNRHADQLAQRMMQETACYLAENLARIGDAVGF